MATKKRSTTADKDLKKTVKKLRSQLDRSDAKADKWKKKAGESQAEVKKLTKRLDTAIRTSKRSSADDTSPTAAPIPAVAAPPDTRETVDTDVSETAVADASEPTAAPDESWTVVQLRAEARSRGLSGLSGKSKAQLLEALG